MKNQTLLLSLFILIIFPLAGFTQDIKWVKYKSSDPAFVVKFPSEYSETHTEASEGKQEKKEATCELESMIFSVTVSFLETESAPQQEIYLATVALESFIETLDAQTIQKQEFKQDDVWGMEAELLLAQGGYKLFARFFVDGNKLYINYVIILNPDADLALKDKFFDSFKLK